MKMRTQGSAALWLCVVLGLIETNSAFEPSVVQVRSPVRFRTLSVDTTVKTDHSISIVGDNFTVDGKPLQIISGSLHYFRVPPAYWKDRLTKLKAAGLNAVSTYVEWSFHEPEERKYSFKGDRNITAFIRLAAELGLHVLLRPGPYICAERDLGGFPYWLLGKYRYIKLRSTDADFMRETKIWLQKLFEQVTPLLFGNGGPIILVQVENEYGSYSGDMEYKTQMRDIFQKHVGDKALLYTTDGAPESLFKGGAIPGVLTTVDFGTGRDSWKQFEALRRFMPHGPLMNSEFYPGWLTHWGERFQQVSTEDVTMSLEDLLNHSANLNFYVFFGGTNFEFTAGANDDGTYTPDITSYDYDAPLTEAGDPTAKYFAIRDTLAKHFPHVNEIPPPTPSQKAAYGEITLTKIVSLLSPTGRSTLGKKYKDDNGVALPTFEELRQRSGLMLYETNPRLVNAGSVLEIKKPRDRIQVYGDGVYIGTISRTEKKYTLTIKSQGLWVISFLVENQGRINYGGGLHDFKGILSGITIDNVTLNDEFSITGFPLEDMDNVETSYIEVHGPVLFEGYFTIPDNEQPRDTFFDTTSWGKGYIWVNGHNLGRYWPTAGPQVTLYVPGCWLHPAPAQNRVQVLELDIPPTGPYASLYSIDHPILNRTAGLESSTEKRGF